MYSVSGYEQHTRARCDDLNGSAVPLFNRYSDLPVADYSEVLTAADDKPESVRVRGCMRKGWKAAGEAATCAGETASIERCMD